MGCLGKAILNGVLLTRLSEIASIQNEHDSVALVTLSMVMGSPQGKALVIQETTTWVSLKLHYFNNCIQNEVLLVFSECNTSIP